MRLAIVLALVSGSALAQGRVYDRTCDVASRRSSRGGVACATNACVAVPAPSGSKPLSKNIYTVSWTLINGGGPVVPVITAAATAGPDCVASSAQQIDLPTVGAAAYSGVFQANGCPTPAGNQTQSIYLKGVSGSGSITMCSFAVAPNCVTCAFVSTAWTQCSRPNINTGASGDFFFGYDTGDTGGIGGSAVSFYAWGADCVDF